MPLFMDVHKGSEFTLEEVKNAHLADLEVQDRYGVHYIQYWVNDKDGMVFCLMEGPDKEACAKVHAEAHGDIACNIIQVERGDYEMVMGKTSTDEFGMVDDGKGNLDSGYRIFLVITFVGAQNVIHKLETSVGEMVRKFHGRELIHPQPEILAVFNSCQHAVSCSRAIQDYVNEYRRNGTKAANRLELRMGLGAGEPVTDNDGFFGDSIRLTRRLNEMAGKNQILISSLVKDLCMGSRIRVKPQNGLFKVLTPAEERLLTKVMEVAEERLSDHQFTVEHLSHQVGMSRPQLYRKMIGLADCSPHDLIKELRLKKAERLMRKRDQNISQIAYKVGFNNPAYFSKCFFDRFGSLPSRYALNS